MIDRGLGFFSRRHTKIFLYFLPALTDTNPMETLLVGQILRVGSHTLTVLAISAESVTVSRRLMTGQTVTVSYRVK